MTEKQRGFIILMLYSTLLFGLYVLGDYVGWRRGRTEGRCEVVATALASGLRIGGYCAEADRWLK